MSKYMRIEPSVAECESLRQVRVVTGVDKNGRVRSRLERPHGSHIHTGDLRFGGDGIIECHFYQCVDCGARPLHGLTFHDCHPRGWKEGKP